MEQEDFSKKNHAKWWRIGAARLAGSFVLHGGRDSGDQQEEEEEA